MHDAAAPGSGSTPGIVLTPTLSQGERENAALAGEGTSGPAERFWTQLAGEYDNMLACVRCGLCLTACPTYVLTAHEAEGPRGRVAMARALAEGRVGLSPDLVAHERSCLVCDACTAVCPCAVHMDRLQVALRAALERAVARPWWERALRHVAFRWLLGDPRGLRLVVRALWMYQRAGIQAVARQSGLLRLLRLGYLDALLPAIPSHFVVPRGERYPATPAGVGRVASASTAAGAAGAAGALGERPPLSSDRVALFAGCVMATALAELDRATIRVLQRAGHEVVDPRGQACCGALHAHDGDLAGARALARRNVAAFEPLGDAPIVVNSAGCGAMLKDYGRLLAAEPAWRARAAAFAARVRDLAEFLAPGVEARLPMPVPSRGPVAASVTYHDACHLAHAQGITREPRALLCAIPGLDLREMAERTLCCGSAGVYNLTHPQEARELRRRRLDHALATGADVIATANPGCLLHLRAGLAERGSRVPVRHIVELLDAASAPCRGAG